MKIQESIVSAHLKTIKTCETRPDRPVRYNKITMRARDFNNSI